MVSESRVANVIRIPMPVIRVPFKDVSERQKIRVARGKRTEEYIKERGLCKVYDPVFKRNKVTGEGHPFVRAF